jgi:hypothetical protein
VQLRCCPHREKSRLSILVWGDWLYAKRNRRHPCNLAPLLKRDRDGFIMRAEYITGWLPGSSAMVLVEAAVFLLQDEDSTRADGVT